MRVSSSPILEPDRLVEAASRGDEPSYSSVASFLDRGLDDYGLYSYSRTALYDVMRQMSRNRRDRESKDEGRIGGKSSGDGRIGDKSSGDGRIGGKTNREGSSGEVLTPSFVCCSLKYPTEKAGLDVVYYDVDRDLRPDVADIEDRVTQDTVAVFSVDYFGFPNRIEGIEEVCSEHDLLHIRDAAHSALSERDGDPVVSEGDVAVGSLWKSVPIPNGSVLSVNDRDKLERFTGGDFTMTLSRRNPGLSRSDYRHAVVSSLARYVEYNYAPSVVSRIYKGVFGYSVDILRALKGVRKSTFRSSPSFAWRRGFLY